MRPVLATDSDHRALELRDHLLPLVRARGVIEHQQGAVRVTVLETEGLRILHWTPFNELSADQASSPAYRQALDGQRTREALDYGLDVWFGGKVLSVLWNSGGRNQILHFTRGAWEAMALEL